MWSAIKKGLVYSYVVYRYKKYDWKYKCRRKVANFNYIAWGSHNGHGSGLQGERGKFCLLGNFFNRPERGKKRATSGKNLPKCAFFAIIK